MVMSAAPPVSVIPAQTGVAFVLFEGATLTICDPEGAQVCDLAAYSAADVREQFSPGRTIDYAQTIAFGPGSKLYSNRSEVMLEIVHDDVGVHDCLLTPCSGRMFEILRGQKNHPSCHGNLARSLALFGIEQDDVSATFNAFMNVRIGADGSVTVETPPSRAGNCIVLRARMDLIVGLTACSSEHSNGGRCKPIHYWVEQ